MGSKNKKLEGTTGVHSPVSHAMPYGAGQLEIRQQTQFHYRAGVCPADYEDMR